MKFLYILLVLCASGFFCEKSLSTAYPLPDVQPSPSPDVLQWYHEGEVVMDSVIWATTGIMRAIDDFERVTRAIETMNWSMASARMRVEKARKEFGWATLPETGGIDAMCTVDEAERTGETIEKAMETMCTAGVGVMKAEVVYELYAAVGRARAKMRHGPC